MSQSNDGRKRVRRTLPPLAKACAGFKSFTRGENRTERVTELLTAVIQRERQRTAQPFYSMRDVAGFFDVSMTTVARIYRRLGTEGILTLVRSSQTMMAPRKTRAKFAVRGVVCAPIWLPGFLQFLDWRRWFSLLEEELARYRFVLEPIFYRQNESLQPTFVDRILKFNPDYVLWNNPCVGDLPPIQSIADTGVHLLVVKNSPGNYPGRVYQQSFERGLREGLKAWEKDRKINRIVIPRMGASGEAHPFDEVLKECALPIEYKAYASEQLSLPSYLRELKLDRKTGIIFLDDFFYTRLCLLVPDFILKLFRQHRVMVIRQATLPHLDLPTGVKVDALIFLGKRLARQIATDLGKGEGTQPFRGAPFEAEWRPRTPLTELIQNHMSE